MLSGGVLNVIWWGVECYLVGCRMLSSGVSNLIWWGVNIRLSLFTSYVSHHELLHDNATKVNTMWWTRILGDIQIQTHGLKCIPREVAYPHQSPGWTLDTQMVFTTYNSGEDISTITNLFSCSRYWHVSGRRITASQTNDSVNSPVDGRCLRFFLNFYLNLLTYKLLFKKFTSTACDMFLLIQDWSVPGGI